MTVPRIELKTPAIGAALLVVDVQNDFMPGGALGIQDSDRIVPAINRAIALFQSRHLPVLYARDWHPADHTSFLVNGGIWPVHCVQHTEGADFFPDLFLSTPTMLFSKGQRTAEDQYSAFEAEDDAGCTLGLALRRLGIKRVYIGGLTTDYGVLNTTLDLLQAGYQAIVLTDGCHALNVAPNDGIEAIENMVSHGAVTMTAAELGTVQP